MVETAVEMAQVRRRRRLRRLVALSAALLLTALVGGTFGFWLTEDLSLADGLYQAVITATTLGYSHLDAPATAGGQLVLVGTLVLGVLGIFGGIVAALTESFELLTGMHRAGDVDRSGHTVVCGYGRIGRVVADQLRSGGTDVVVIERDEHRSEVARNADFDVVMGDAGDDSVLRDACADRASSVVTTFSDDARNVFVAVSARTVKPDVVIAATASSEETAEKLRRVGVDRVVATEVAAGHMLSRAVTAPLAVDLFLGSISGTDFVEHTVEPDSNLVGQTMGSLVDQGIVVVAYRRDDEIEPNPDVDTEIEPGMRLLLHGAPGGIAGFEPTQST